MSAPVESALACWAQNMWSGLRYQMTAGETTLDSALRHFFEELLLKAPLSGMKIEMSAALTWQSKDLLGTNIPPDVQQGLRLRIKLATNDPGPASRTLLEITSIDFKLA